MKTEWYITLWRQFFFHIHFDLDAWIWNQIIKLNWYQTFNFKTTHLNPLAGQPCIWVLRSHTFWWSDCSGWWCSLHPRCKLMYIVSLSWIGKEIFYRVIVLKVLMYQEYSFAKLLKYSMHNIFTSTVYLILHYHEINKFTQKMTITNYIFCWGFSK